MRLRVDGLLSTGAGTVLYKNIIKVSTVQEKDQLREIFDNWKENNQERRFLHI